MLRGRMSVVDSTILMKRSLFTQARQIKKEAVKLVKI